MIPINLVDNDGNVRSFDDIHEASAYLAEKYGPLFLEELGNPPSHEEMVAHARRTRICGGR